MIVYWRVLVCGWDESAELKIAAAVNHDEVVEEVLGEDRVALLVEEALSIAEQVVICGVIVKFKGQSRLLQPQIFNLKIYSLDRSVNVVQEQFLSELWEFKLLAKALN